MKRDPVEEIIAYHRPLVAEGHRVPDREGRDVTREALGRKLDALARTPFAFFRGTFHLMAKDVLSARVPGAQAAAPDALIVGDLHLENFGVYRGATGGLCFEINDFDDVGFGPADLDLKRLCTSALLLPDVSASARLKAAKAIAASWASAVEKLGGRFPIPPWDDEKAREPVTELFREKGRRTASDLIAKAAPGKNHAAFGEDGEPRRFAHVGKAWQATVNKALDEYREALEQLKVPVSHVWDVLDVAYRFKGTGSLGRLRFCALLGRGPERRILEVKEARPSAMDRALGRPEGFARARVQTAGIRRLQAAPWPRVAGTHLGKVSALCREVQPEEEKLGSVRFASGDAGHRQLLSYATQCGEVTARLLVRANAPLLLDVPWRPADAARAAVAFAQKYAATVQADQRAFVKSRKAVARALGLA
jgi:Uncharacterized protein conserved in bacteria (DUF2252)